MELLSINSVAVLCQKSEGDVSNDGILYKWVILIIRKLLRLSPVLAGEGFNRTGWSFFVSDFLWQTLEIFAETFPKRRPRILSSVITYNWLFWQHQGQGSRGVYYNLFAGGEEGEKIRSFLRNSRKVKNYLREMPFLGDILLILRGNNLPVEGDFFWFFAPPVVYRGSWIYEREGFLGNPDLCKTCVMWRLD